MAANPLFPPQLLELETRRAEDALTVVCHGRITSQTTNLLQDRVRALVPQEKRIVLDLGDVDYMDSSGLGALIGVYVSVTRHGGQLRLVHLNERIMQLLRITKLLSVFEGYGEYL